MLRIASSTVAFLALSAAFNQSALAQIVDPPRGGSQIQQIPPAPAPQRAIPEIRIEQGSAPAIPGADSLRFPVRSLRVSGQSLYTEAELVGITGFVPGGDVTLAELRGMAS